MFPHRKPLIISLLRRGSSVRYINPLCEVYRRRKVEWIDPLCLHDSADPPHPKKNPLSLCGGERLIIGIFFVKSCSFFVKSCFSETRYMVMNHEFSEQVSRTWVARDCQLPLFLAPPILTPTCEAHSFFNHRSRMCCAKFWLGERYIPSSLHRTRAVEHLFKGRKHSKVKQGTVYCIYPHLQIQTNT